MGTRNTPEQQRAYSAAYAERQAAAGKRRVSVYLPSLLALSVERTTKAQGRTMSAAAEEALAAWLLQQPPA